MKALAEKYYGALQPTPGLTDRLRPQEPPQLAERRLTMPIRASRSPIVVRTYLVPERDPGDQKTAAALTMLAEIAGRQCRDLGAGPQAAVRHPGRGLRLGLLRRARYDDTTFGYVDGAAGRRRPGRGRGGAGQGGGRFLDEGIDDAQFERIRMQLQRGLIYDDDDIGRQARNYGAALTSGLTLADVKAWPDILQAVTKDEVMAAAKTLLDRRQSVTGWLMPADKAEVMQ